MPKKIPTKLYLAISLLLVTFSQLKAQGSFTYNLTVTNKDQSPKANLEVVLIETNTFIRKVYRTSANGTLTIVLKEEDGANWMVNIGDMRNYTILNVPAGSIGSGSAQLTYDVERWQRQNQPAQDRTNLVFDEITQRVAANERPLSTEEVVEIYVVSKGNRPYYDLEVKMTSYALGQSYVARTDEAGIARFKLPLNEQFQVDLDGEDDFSFYDTGKQSSFKRVTLTYEKIDFNEVPNKAGYIEQIFIQEPKPVSNRVMVVLTITGGPKDGVKEDVYIQTDYSSKKYHGITNSSGQVAFLLPKKKTYHVNFPYQNDAGVIDLSRFFGIGYASQSFHYEPDPRLQYPENYLPTKTDVKSYDINNYLTTRYPDTPDDELLNVHVKWGSNKINSGSKEALLELGFSIKEPKNKAAISKPLNIAFVLDKSGSMSGQKMDILKDAMLKLIDKLRPEDRVALVLFDTEAVLAFGEQKFDKKYIEDIIYAMQAGGGTSIYEGLKLGYEVVERNKLANSVNRVILLTDGYGSKPVDFILEQSAQYFKKGISVSTIGVGGGYNHALLSLLSEYSGGLNHQALASEGISVALEKEFESLLYPLASNLTVKVKYNNVLIYKTLYGIPEKKNADNMVYFELPKVFSSLNQMALMKFKIENPERDMDKNKIRIEISYFDEIKQAQVDLVKETALEWTDETDVELIRDAELKKTYSLAVINQSLKLIADLCDAKNYTGAKQLINQTLKSLKDISGDKYAPELIPIIEELKQTLIYLDRAIAKG